MVGAKGSEPYTAGKQGILHSVQHLENHRFIKKKKKGGKHLAHNAEKI